MRACSDAMSPIQAKHLGSFSGRLLTHLSERCRSGPGDAERKRSCIRVEKGLCAPRIRASAPAVINERGTFLQGTSPQQLNRLAPASKPVCKHGIGSDLVEAFSSRTQRLQSASAAVCTANGSPRPFARSLLIDIPLVCPEGPQRSL